MDRGFPLQRQIRKPRRHCPLSLRSAIRLKAASGSTLRSRASDRRTLVDSDCRVRLVWLFRRTRQPDLFALQDKEQDHHPNRRALGVLEAADADRNSVQCLPSGEEVSRPTRSRASRQAGAAQRPAC